MEAIEEGLQNDREDLVNERLVHRISNADKALKRAQKYLSMVKDLAEELEQEREKNRELRAAIARQ